MCNSSAPVRTPQSDTGWALSAVLALPLGLLIGSYRGVQALLEPLTDFIRYMPAVAFIPLVMLWFGIEESSKVAVIFIGTFFQMVLMVAEDVKRVPMSQIEAAQTMGATRRELLEQVILPSAKPALLDTLRVTMGWAWTYLVVAELVAANSGLGYSILKAQRYLQTDQIFAGIVLIGAIGLAMRSTRRRPQTERPLSSASSPRRASAPACTRNPCAPTGMPWSTPPTAVGGVTIFR